jgi:transcriptional regulator with XRE-family HTH domain
MNIHKSKEFNHERLGSVMKKYRLHYGLSIDELAELMGLSSVFVGLMEKGARGVNLKNVVRLSEIFDVDVNLLLYDEYFEKDKTQDFSKTEETLEEMKLRTLKAICSNLGIEELDYITANVKNLMKMKGRNIE